jgi:hypothetical protein
MPGLVPEQENDVTRNAVPPAPTFGAKRQHTAPGKTIGRQKIRAVRRIFHARQLTGEVSALMTTDSGRR